MPETPRLGPLTVPKASDVLAAELRERILDGEFAEGTALPAERELVTQTRMSRSTVREALRILEVQGLLRIRTGRGGGAFVRRPGRESVARSVELVIRGHDIRLDALLETREAIEPSCAALAAVHRTDEDLAALEAATELMAEASAPIEEFLRANIDWHVAVATAGRNEILAGLMTALSAAVHGATRAESTRFADPEIRHQTVLAHRAVTRAIRAGDAPAASRRMARHVTAYAAEAR
ncbi:FadR/GntR family transcriptional regulator [Phaeacidiphilus oryzae]|uniref:FadR/GntR family transcriptional regulator n=1 Tax=Phaeacidiphilus oryzae TaxID=348818 RepID=UPI00055D7029|nr:FCD domain-containing protein [Phaeacidiphilus oryzae]